MKLFLLKVLLIIFDEHVVPSRLPPAERKVKDQHISYLQTERKLLATFYSTRRNSFIPCWPPPADPLKSQALAEARGTLTILSARSHYLNSSWQTVSPDKALLILKIGLLLLTLACGTALNLLQLANFPVWFIQEDRLWPCLLFSPFGGFFFPRRAVLPGSHMRRTSLQLLWEVLATTTIFVFCLWYLL